MNGWMDGWMKHGLSPKIYSLRDGIHSHNTPAPAQVWQRFELHPRQIQRLEVLQTPEGRREAADIRSLQQQAIERLQAADGVRQLLEARVLVKL